MMQFSDTQTDAIFGNWSRENQRGGCISCLEWGFCSGVWWWWWKSRVGICSLMYVQTKWRHLTPDTLLPHSSFGPDDHDDDVKDIADDHDYDDNGVKDNTGHHQGPFLYPFPNILFSPQSIMKDAYDHHAAIYFLLLDRLKTQKSSLSNMGR